jgi:hypothetical protein
MKEFFGNFVSEVHEAVASLVLGLVIVHVIAAIGMSVIEKQNLVRSMVTGKKKGFPEQGIRYPQYLIGAFVILGTIYFFYLILSGALPAFTQ